MSLGFQAWTYVRSRTTELLLPKSPLEQDKKLVQKYVNRSNEVFSSNLLKSSIIIINLKFILWFTNISYSE